MNNHRGQHPILFRRIVAIAVLSLTLFLTWTKSFAADIAPVPDIAVEAPVSAVPEWTFSIAPYFWMAGLDGTVGVGGQEPSDINVNFSQVFNHIDWWPPPIMFAGEARNDRFAIFTDFLYLGLQGEGSTQGPRPLAASISTNVLIWNIGGAYRILDNSGTTLDVTAGGRLWYLNADETLTGPLSVTEASGSRTWFDPLVGLAGGIDLGKGFRLHGEADVGGFSVGAKLDWQAQATLQYQYSQKLMLEAGYRYLAVDYDKDGFIFDSALAGPIIGASFRF